MTGLEHPPRPQLSMAPPHAAEMQSPSDKAADRGELEPVRGGVSAPEEVQGRDEEEIGGGTMREASQPRWEGGKGHRHTLTELPSSTQRCIRLSLE
jgi:hypothetical protein